MTGNRFCTPSTTALARSLRNGDDYDDWSYGTEPIPCDTSWTSPETLDQLLCRVAQAIEQAETLNSRALAYMVISEVLKLPVETLASLKTQDSKLS